MIELTRQAHRRRAGGPVDRRVAFGLRQQVCGTGSGIRKDNAKKDCPFEQTSSTQATELPSFRPEPTLPGGLTIIKYLQAFANEDVEWTTEDAEWKTKDAGQVPAGSAVPMAVKSKYTSPDYLPGLFPAHLFVWGFSQFLITSSCVVVPTRPPTS